MNQTIELIIDDSGLVNKLKTMERYKSRCKLRATKNVGNIVLKPNVLIDTLVLANNKLSNQTNVFVDKDDSVFEDAWQATMKAHLSSQVADIEKTLLLKAIRLISGKPINITDIETYFVKWNMSKLLVGKSNNELLEKTFNIFGDNGPENIDRMKSAIKNRFMLFYTTYSNSTDNPVTFDEYVQDVYRMGFIWETMYSDLRIMVSELVYTLQISIMQNKFEIVQRTILILKSNFAIKGDTIQDKVDYLYTKSINLINIIYKAEK